MAIIIWSFEESALNWPPANELDEKDGKRPHAHLVASKLRSVFAKWAPKWNPVVGGQRFWAGPNPVQGKNAWDFYWIQPESSFTWGDIWKNPYKDL